MRYERSRPGELVHIDVKKLGRIVGGPGKRAFGDGRRHASRSYTDLDGHRRGGKGWEYVHIAIDVDRPVSVDGGCSGGLLFFFFHLLVVDRRQVVPPVNAEFLHERLPRSKLDILDAGHFTWEDAADEYAALVASWWSEGSTTVSPAATSIE